MPTAAAAAAKAKTSDTADQEGGGTRKGGLEDVLGVAEAALECSLSPLLNSRKRVRTALRAAMESHSSLRELWHAPGEF